MKRCSARPYEGSEKYVFVSYCHKDKAYVYPIIEQLAKEGVRIWYDEGIDPGSEWPEIIASHLNNCHICISFITRNSIKSHNCRREINFALLKKKTFVSVVLEPVELSLGMQMQLSATQAIFKYKLERDAEFFLKLYEVKSLYDCKGNPNKDIVVSRPEDYDDTPGQEPNEGPIKDPRDIPEQPNNPVRSEWGAALVRSNSLESFKIKEGDNLIGRGKDCDCIISGNGSISRKHAIIRFKDEKYYLIDNNAPNGTYLNSIMLAPEKEYELANGDIIKLDNERFEFQINM